MSDLDNHLRHAAADLYLARCSLEQAMLGATATQKAKLKDALLKIREGDVALSLLRFCGNGG